VLSEQRARVRLIGQTAFAGRRLADTIGHVASRHGGREGKPGKERVMHMRGWCGGLTAAALLGTVGCSDSPPAPRQQPSPPRVSAEPAATLKQISPETKPIHMAAGEPIKPVRYADYEGVVAGLKGKVVLVDFWAIY
jgi:hypothetical protein